MIPNQFHFVFGMAPDFGGKPFSLVHYLAIRSAALTSQPDTIYFHYQYEPTGEWWEKAKPYLTLNQIQAPEAIHGNRLHHVAHRSDVVRLQVLHEFGGIYLDLDVICKKTFAPLLRHSFVIGNQYAPTTAYDSAARYLWRVLKKVTTGQGHTARSMGLCNAVMLAEKRSPFVARWLEGYKTFRSTGRDAYWGEHSVQLPLLLARRYPHLVTIQGGNRFHFPLYDPRGLSLLFEETCDFPGAFAHHLWETYSWEAYLNKLTPELIRTCDSTYNCLARQLL